jgi:hypothetical protein
MIKKILSIIFILIVLNITAQNKFSQISRPEKIWVLMHPFSSKKAFNITKNVLIIVDSIKAIGIIGCDINGGKLDAFKHAYWMANLSKSIGNKKAKSLGIAHEKGNKLQFKKQKTEDRILPDSISCEMDLFNNIQGIEIGTNSPNMNLKEMQLATLNNLKNGKLRVLKKDNNGNYLTSQNTLINLNDWFGKWNIPKCLEPSY